MKQIIYLINKLLRKRKLFLQVVRMYPQHKPKENSIVYAHVLTDLYVRCMYSNGKFLSLNDGSEIEYVNSFLSSK